MIAIVEKREPPFSEVLSQGVYLKTFYIYMYIYRPPSSEHPYEAHLGHTYMGDVGDGNI